MVEGDEKRASIASTNRQKTVSRAKIRRKSIVLVKLARMEVVVFKWLGLDIGEDFAGEED
jgi:hypothetical protein